MYNIELIYEELEAKTKLTADLIQMIFTNAVEEAVKLFLNVKTVIVHHDERQVTAFFETPSELPLKEAEIYDGQILDGDIAHITFDFEAFPKVLYNKIRDLFKLMLIETSQHQLQRLWKKRLRTIVEGVIEDKTSTQVFVKLPGGIIGVMDKKYWVPRETDRYYSGNNMYFYIRDVRTDPLQILLSRASNSLPALLLKCHMPWARFKCIKRYIGHKSILRSNIVEISSSVKHCVKMVGDELSGELIVINPKIRGADY